VFRKSVMIKRMAITAMAVLVFGVSGQQALSDDKSEESKAAKPSWTPDPAKMFAEMDRDDDGNVTEQEFVTAFEMRAKKMREHMRSRHEARGGHDPPRQRHDKSRHDRAGKRNKSRKGSGGKECKGNECQRDRHGEGSGKGQCRNCGRGASRGHHGPRPAAGPAVHVHHHHYYGGGGPAMHHSGPRPPHHGRGAPGHHRRQPGPGHGERPRGLHHGSVDLDIEVGDIEVGEFATAYGYGEYASEWDLTGAPSNMAASLFDESTVPGETVEATDSVDSFEVRDSDEVAESTDEATTLESAELTESANDAQPDDV